MFTRVITTTWIALLLLSLSSSFGLAQQGGSVLYFANEEFRVAKLIERKQILEYRVVTAGERRYRETFFDSADLYLFERRMFYRVKDGFDGQARVEFYPGHAANDAPLVGFIHSKALPASTVLAVGNGRLDDPALRNGLPVPGARQLVNIQVTAEYAKHSITLGRQGRAEFLVSVLDGKFVGLTGKKVATGFLAVEIQPLANRGAHGRDIKRIVDALRMEIRLSPNAGNLYARAIEKCVLLRPDERRLQALRIFGGAKGSGFDQFDAPDALAFTLDGRLVAGDTDNARFKLYSFTDQTQTVEIVGRAGAAAGEFDHSLAASLGSFKVYHQVQGIAVDGGGLIYAIDQGNQRIQVFDASGKVLPDKVLPLRFCAKDAPRCSDGLWRPTKKTDYNSVQGLAIDNDGGIFISDKGMGRVYRILSDGRLDANFNFQELDAVNQRPTLKEPESLALYQDKLFVASEGHGDIQIFDRRSGKVAGSAFGADIFGGKVEGLAVVRGYLFAVDVQNNRIAVFDLAAEKPRFLMGFVGDFDSADGIAIDRGEKYLAVADQGNFRVLLYSLGEIFNHLGAHKR